MRAKSFYVATVFQLASEGLMCAREEPYVPLPSLTMLIPTPCKTRRKTYATGGRSLITKQKMFPHQIREISI